MRLRFILVLIVVWTLSIYAQLKPTSPTSDIEFHKRNKMVELDEQSTVINFIPAKYPETAIKDSIEGQVWVEALIDTLGNAKEVSIHQGVREDIDIAAMDAMRKCKFTPGKVKGKAVESTSMLCMKFKLSPMSLIKKYPVSDSLIK